MPKKQMPAAERQQESGQCGWLLRWPSRITGWIPALVAGRCSALTWAGEPVKIGSLRLLEPRGKLGAGDGERT
jgi:hypothetical protein